MTRAPRQWRAESYARDRRESDDRAEALRDVVRRAGGGSPFRQRARLRAGTRLMRLGAFEDAHAEFLIAAEGRRRRHSRRGAAACRGRRARRRASWTA